MSVKTLLTLSWPGKFLFHPKIGCLNFKPQYLLNYSSSTNDLYSVHIRSIRVFKSIFKLLGWPLGCKVFRAKSSVCQRLRRTGSELCAKTLHASSLNAFQHVSKHSEAALTQCWYQWVKRVRNEKWENGKSALIFLWFFCLIFWISETSRQYSVKRRRMLCNIVWNSN